MYGFSYSRAPDIFGPEKDFFFLRQPIRPLGNFSTYVVEVMPHKVSALLANPATNVESELKEMGQEMAMHLPADALGLFVPVRKHTPQQKQHAMVARVDVVFAHAALLQTALSKKQVALLDGRNMESLPGDEKQAIEAKLKAYAEYVYKEIVPPRLNDLVKQSGHYWNALPTITYEDMVLFNPLEKDPRVFTTRDAGRVEYDFYNAHRYIEHLMETGAGLLEKGLNEAPEKLAAILGQVTRRFKETTDILDVFLNKMRQGPFNTFRTFFGGNRALETTGPSGRFSAGIPFPTVLLVGDILHQHNPTFFNALFKHRSYFPAAGFAKILNHIRPEFCPENFQVRPAFRRLAAWIRDRKPVTVHQVLQRHGYPEALVQAFDECRAAHDASIKAHIHVAYRFVLKHGNAGSGTPNMAETDRILMQRGGIAHIPLNVPGRGKGRTQAASLEAHARR